MMNNEDLHPHYTHKIDMGRTFPPRSQEMKMKPDPLSDGELIQLANMLCALKGDPILSAEYRNYRGEVSTREFTPKRVFYGSTDWHPEPGLMLSAFDHGKNAMRDFALVDFDMSTLRSI